MEASRMTVRSLGALDSIGRIEKRMHDTESDELAIIDTRGVVHPFDGANLSKVRLERTGEGWLWICLREGLETIFQECVYGIVAIGSIVLEKKNELGMNIVLTIEDSAEDASLSAIADVLEDLAKDGLDTLTLHGSAIAQQLLAISRNLRVRCLEIHGSERELNLCFLSGFDRHLQSLYLMDCRIPPGGFAALRDIKRLEMLSLHHVEMPSDEFAHLAHLPKFDTLWVTGLHLDAVALSHVGRCLGITDLWLDVDSLHSRALHALSQLPLLRELVLDCSDIGDAEVPFLLGLSSLDHLDVKNTNITEVGLKCLRKHLPYLGTLEPETRSQGEARRCLRTNVFDDLPGSVIAISERHPA